MFMNTAIATPAVKHILHQMCQMLNVPIHNHQSREVSWKWVQQDK